MGFGGTLKNQKTILLASMATALFTLAACNQKMQVAQDEVSAKNLVELDSNVEQKIGEGENSFLVIGSSRLEARLKDGSLKTPEQASKVFANSKGRKFSDPASPAVHADAINGVQPNTTTLMVGFPVSLLDKNAMFGAVVTKVSDQKSEDLGRLKLTDLPPLPVKPGAGNTPNGVAFGLFGCVENCTATSEEELVQTFPVKAVDEANKLIILDLSAIGKDMDFISMMDPDGQFTQTKPKSSKTVLVDFSQDTLVFDVESLRVPAGMNPNNPQTPVISFTTRWYIKVGTDLNPNFVSRKPRPEAGFFTTSRMVEPLISRLNISANSTKAMKYYIKNVPNEYRPAFKAAFDEWNSTFVDLIGKKVFDYEFVEANDPRHKLLVPGDVRYRIVEWDLVNQAPYGGLGPNIANPLSGEAFTSNVLVQGPTIVELYKAWFSASESANNLILAGDPAGAEEVLVSARRQILAMVDKLNAAPKVALSLGKMKFRVTSQMPQFEDPIAARVDFTEIPTGYTYETYMFGYFKEMLAHELGHNIGLRHNFKGNLGAKDTLQEKKVSRSVMEYLGRGFRHLNHINEYDKMAILYGYAGVAPTHADWFCTDEEATGSDSPESIGNSAECSKDDATNDPFGYLESILNRAVGLLIAKGSTSAPVWTVEDMEREVEAAVQGLSGYASSAVNHFTEWTNFLKTGRPTSAGQVKSFVNTRLKTLVCSDAINAEILAKPTVEAQNKAKANLTALKAKMATLSAPYGVPAVTCQ